MPATSSFAWNTAFAGQRVLGPLSMVDSIWLFCVRDIGRSLASVIPALLFS